jgi:hypothetical protein
MQRPSHNPSNYYLTQDGVISKIDTYWDKLSEASEDLESASRYVFRRLINSFAGSTMGVLPVFWLSPSKTIGMFALVAVLVMSLFATGVQWVVWYEFQSLKTRSLILYEALKLEMSREYFEEEDIPLEERILLNQFALSARFPVHGLLYMFLLVLLPSINASLMYLYYFYW